jgi:sugar transferase (PEP-CTERM/EpsH1 system associated)
MANILFLAHRIPYPPNKGDKIRSWHILEHLLKQHVVHLGCFVDDEKDLEYRSFLSEKTASSCFDFVTQVGQKVSALYGFLSGKALSVSAYPKAKLERYAEDVLSDNNIDLVYVFSGAMMEFTEAAIAQDIPVILDLVDVDSAKWADYARESMLPVSALYRREAKLLLQYEEKSTQKAARTFFVSNAEAQLFNDLTNTQFKERVCALKNGVDLNRFDIQKYGQINYRQVNNDGTVILFTGAMDYRPNVEAVLWFAHHVWPTVKSQYKDAIFKVAGGPVAPSIQQLNGFNGIEVTGYVDDMAEEISHADIVVAPLKTARGIQNKVLEGMAMAKPVVATSLANEGIDAEHEVCVFVADKADAFADKIITLMQSFEHARNVGENARKFIEDNFTWEQSLKILDAEIDTVLKGKR